MMYGRYYCQQRDTWYEGQNSTWISVRHTNSSARFQSLWVATISPLPLFCYGLPELPYLHFFTDFRATSPARLYWLPELLYLHFFDSQSCLTSHALLWFPELPYLYWFTDCLSCLTCISLLTTRVASLALLWLTEFPHLYFFADCQSCLTCT